MSRRKPVDRGAMARRAAMVGRRFVLLRELRNRAGTIIAVDEIVTVSTFCRGKRPLSVQTDDGRYVSGIEERAIGPEADASESAETRCYDCDRVWRIGYAYAATRVGEPLPCLRCGSRRARLIDVVVGQYVRTAYRSDAELAAEKEGDDA